MEEQLGDRPLTLDLQEAWVPLDPVLLEQVLLNLLDNALKFSPPGSPIDIATGTWSDQAWLTVEDAGPGFAAGRGGDRVREAATGAAVPARRPGAGLGLAICRGIVQAHGGTIVAANRSQGGARITLTLPMEGTPPALPQEGSPP